MRAPLVFLLVASAIWAFAHYYVGRRIIRPLELEGRKKALAWGLVWFLWLFGPITFVLGFSGVEGGWAVPFAVGSFTYMGVFFLLFAFVLVRDLALIPIRIHRWAKKQEMVDPDRRSFLTNASNGAIAFVAAGLSSWGFVEATRVSAVTTVDVPIDGLPEELEGYRIVQLSDIHIGPTIKGGWLQEVVGAANALEPDLVAVTGDLIDGYVDDLRPHVAPLGGLRARDGLFFVTGNHEYYWDVDAWCEEVERLGFSVLNNAHQTFRRGDATVVVAGATDYRASRIREDHASDPEKALAGAPPAELKLLLAHQPRSIDGAVRAGFDLQLSGHTHGGQFFPVSLFVGLAHPFSEGLGRRDRTWIYVNRGTGYWGPPLRAGVPSEITLLRLVRA
ncbi:MAG: metallophosphoesterase [Myxococcota bacterium]